MKISAINAAPAAVIAAADRLSTAARTAVPCPSVRDLIDAEDLDAAYAVQGALVAERVSAGAVVVGRTIGCTSAAVREQLGLDRPVTGVLLDDMAYDRGDAIPAKAVLQPRVEAEIAFVLGDDLVEGELDAEQVRAATAYVAAAIEICGSRVADWDLSLADNVADNASSGAFVLGRRRRSLADFDPASATMSMEIDGLPVSTGVGSACLGDPVDAVVWLARRARELGDPLRAGQVILSGSLGPLRPLRRGSTVMARISGLGRVRFTWGGQG